MRTGVIKVSELAQMPSWKAGDVLDCQRVCSNCHGHGTVDVDGGPEAEVECGECDGRGYIFEIPDAKAFSIGEVLYTAVGQYADKRASRNNQNEWANMTLLAREGWEAAARFMLAFLEDSNAIEVVGYAEREARAQAKDLMSDDKITAMLRQHESGLTAMSTALAVQSKATLAIIRDYEAMSDKVNDLIRLTSDLWGMAMAHDRPTG